MSKSGITNREVQVFILELATQARINGLDLAGSFAAKLAAEKCKLTPTSSTYLDPSRGKRLGELIAQFKGAFGFDPFDFPVNAKGVELVPLLETRIEQMKNAMSNPLSMESLSWYNFSRSKTAGTAQSFIKWYYETVLPNLSKLLSEE